jgi:hypothetical protein
MEQLGTDKWKEENAEFCEQTGASRKGSLWTDWCVQEGEFVNRLVCAGTGVCEQTVRAGRGVCEQTGVCRERSSWTDWCVQGGEFVNRLVRAGRGVCEQTGECREGSLWTDCARREKTLSTDWCVQGGKFVNRRFVQGVEFVNRVVHAGRGFCCWQMHLAFVTNLLLYPSVTRQHCAVKLLPNCCRSSVQCYRPAAVWTGDVIPPVFLLQYLWINL